MTTFDLDIPAPNSREWLALLIGAAALVAGLVINDESWYVQALLTVGGGVLGVAGLAAVLNWIVGMALIRIAQAREIKSTTEQVMIWDRQIQLAHEQTFLVNRLVDLRPDQLDYARELGAFPSLEIDGARVVWVVEHTRIPLWFVMVWGEALGVARHGELPAQSQFDTQPYREACREYHRAIVAALVRLGAAVQPAGPYAARWIVNSAERQAALDKVGFSLAASIAAQTAEGDEHVNTGRAS